VAPSLIGVGAAAVDFQVSTGRMPAQNPGAQVPRKKNIFTDAQVHQLAAYVASLGGGPPVPSKQQADPKTGDAAIGGKLFRANCAQCHNFAGSGGALTGGKFAPPLDEANPQQIYEAMLTGPQAMPVFNDTTLTPAQKRAVIAYVTQTRNEANPGGSGLGRIGPVAEGLAGWLVGIGLMVVAAMWLTARKTKKND
jgi:ubiquinol-cytochrome c reductase cytochrome c subunit